MRWCVVLRQQQRRQRRKRARRHRLIRRQQRCSRRRKHRRLRRRCCKEWNPRASTAARRPQTLAAAKRTRRLRPCGRRRRQRSGAPTGLPRMPCWQTTCARSVSPTSMATCPSRKSGTSGGRSARAAVLGWPSAHARPAASCPPALHAWRFYLSPASAQIFRDPVGQQRQEPQGLSRALPPCASPALGCRVHPSAPADLQAAGVSHGSAAALVTQVHMKEERRRAWVQQWAVVVAGWLAARVAERPTGCGLLRIVGPLLGAARACQP